MERDTSLTKVRLPCLSSLSSKCVLDFMEHCIRCEKANSLSVILPLFSFVILNCGLQIPCTKSILFTNNELCSVVFIEFYFFFYRRKKMRYSFSISSAQRQSQRTISKSINSASLPQTGKNALNNYPRWTVEGEK